MSLYVKFRRSKRNQDRKFCDSWFLLTVLRRVVVASGLLIVLREFLLSFWDPTASSNSLLHSSAPVRHRSSKTCTASCQRTVTLSRSRPSGILIFVVERRVANVARQISLVYLKRRRTAYVSLLEGWILENPVFVRDAQ